MKDGVLLPFDAPTVTVSGQAFTKLSSPYYERIEILRTFVDGNGRTGAILFNWLSGTLLAPKWAPDFWDDQRRTPGHGA
jgi:hypothetical protein